MTEDGDRTDWFSFSDEFLAHMLPLFDPEDLCAPDRPLRYAVSANELLLQRRAFQEALVAPAPDELLLEETLCTMLASLAKARDREEVVAGSLSQEAIAQKVQASLAARFGEPVRLVELAHEIGVSPSHLCRAFRAATGRTIHGFRERLRLAAALERLEEGESNLTELALDLGYSSHAHFATNFRRAFGVAPSAVRSRRLSVPGPRRSP